MGCCSGSEPTPVGKMSSDLLAILPVLVIALGGIGFLLVPVLRSARALGMLTLLFLLIAANGTLQAMLQRPVLPGIQLVQLS